MAVARRDGVKRHLLKREALHADETTQQVLMEPGKAAQSDSYMWLYRTGRGVEPVVIYDYQRTRSGEHPRDFWAGFKGYLHDPLVARRPALPFTA